MSPSSNDPGRADPTDPGSEQRLLTRVRRGSASAVTALFARYAPWLRRRASGRLPQWARSGGISTSDLVQDVLHHTFARLTWFESKHVSALRAYLRRAVENRVQDELRRTIRRLDIVRLAPGEDPLRPFEDAAPQYQQRLQEELWGRYRDGLKLWVANYYSARNPLRLSSLVILGVVARMFRCATRSSCWCT